MRRHHVQWDDTQKDPLSVWTCLTTVYARTATKQVASLTARLIPSSPACKMPALNGLFARIANTLHNACIILFLFGGDGTKWNVK